MKVIAVVVEGQTEAGFVENVLNAHLEPLDRYVQPIIVKTSRPAGGPSARGGGGAWKHYKADIRNALQATHFAAVTTLIDFYGYPQDAPGHACPAPHTPRACVRRRAFAIAQDIRDSRFRPYLLLHEFETLVLASSLEQSQVLGQAELASCLQQICATKAKDVELVNDHPLTCPSHRILQCYPRYRKLRDGVAATEAVGVSHIRRFCPGFSAWVDWLEML